MGDRRGCLFLLLILVAFIESKPRVDVAEKISDLNTEISKDKKLYKVLKEIPGHVLREDDDQENVDGSKNEEEVDGTKSQDKVDKTSEKEVGDDNTNVNLSGDAQVDDSQYAGGNDEIDDAHLKPPGDTGAKITQLTHEEEDTEQAHDTQLNDTGDETAKDTHKDLARDEYTETESGLAPEHEVLSRHVDSDQKFQNTKYRSLEVGDIITPEEMLVLAKAFMKQVKNKGEGKGIISEAQNGFELADKLFERYFMTLQRMVVIRDVDIDGLDALQALSLNGAVVTLRSPAESFTESPRAKYKGFKADDDIELYGTDPADYPKKCHYRVLKKKVTVTEIEATDTNKNKSQVDRRQYAENLKKTFTAKDRTYLVLNPWENITHYTLEPYYPKGWNHRRSYNYKKNKTVKDIQQNTQQDGDIRLATTPVTPPVILLKAKEDNVTCRWKYNCTSPWKLGSCRLFPYCSNNTHYNNMFIETDENLRRFRKAVGISIIDEEVEKIIEMHITRMNMHRHDEDKQIESLMKYFNEIVNANQALETTPMSDKADRPVHPLADAESASSEKDGDSLTEGTSDTDDIQARKMLGVIDKYKDDQEAKQMLGVKKRN